MEMEQEKQAKVTIENEMKRSYLEYAMSVIVGRALPDVRDGLKPVHRRILFAMRELRNDWNKPYKKSARVVGEVIGKYHPHGDSAVYDAIVRMAQDFSLRYPLVDGQGNFGSVDGDAPAAMRYTEVRMMRLAHHLMADLDKETVDFSPNYDGTLEEPSVMPSRIPTLLVNGASGIAVGMTTNVPPHNLSEVIDAITALIDNPALEWTDLMRYIPGPDFPTRGIIYGRQGIMEAYQSGRGIIQVRGRVTIEDDEKSGYATVAVTELPYQVNKARLIEKIAELVRDKQIEGIRFVRDESDRTGMRIAIGLKKDQFPEVVINQLYKHTQLQTSFGIIFLAIVDGRPRQLSLKEILEQFILHRKDVIIRRTRYELRKAEERAHILEGLRIALDNLDAVVALIRRAASPQEAKTGLMETFRLSEIQAQAILDMRLQRLTGLERDKIVADHDQVLKDIAWYREILGSDQIVLGLIKDELAEIRDGFGDNRRTEIVDRLREITLEDMIAEEDMVVTLTNSGYIKRNPISMYHSQHRGGKGKTAMGIKRDDFVSQLFVASTHHTFLFFTNLGRVYWSKVYELPMASRSSLGKAIVNFLNLSEGEQLTTVLAVPEFEQGKQIVMATRNGLVKKTDLMAYSRPRVGGIIAINLVEGDELIAARISDGEMDVLLCTAEGQAIRFAESDVRSTGRVARGVRGIRLSETDHVVAMEMVSRPATLFTATANGYGKRTDITAYPVRSRGGKGVITIKTSQRNGPVVTSIMVDDTDDLMLMTNKGKLIRISATSMSVISRNTQGVRLIHMDADETVIGAARLDEEEQMDEGNLTSEADGKTAEETPDAADGDAAEFPEDDE
ncbi:MAG: DNA gyrase subunit A [Deltaproteobacteria bacterium]|nr:MAG: DNA gyrase subunit A [Deltaproteobacteria bacterium]